MKLGKIKEKLIFCIIFFVDFWKNLVILNMQERKYETDY